MSLLKNCNYHGLTNLHSDLKIAPLSEIYIQAFRTTI